MSVWLVTMAKVLFYLMPVAILWDALVLDNRKHLLGLAASEALRVADVNMHAAERTLLDSARRDDDKDFTLDLDDVYCELPSTFAWVPSRKESVSRVAGNTISNECRSAIADYHETVSKINISYFEPVRTHINGINNLLYGARGLDVVSKKQYLATIRSLKSRTLYLLLNWFEDFSNLVLCKRARMYCYGYEPFCTNPVIANGVESSQGAKLRRLKLNVFGGEDADGQVDDLLEGGEADADFDESHEDEGVLPSEDAAEGIHGAELGMGLDNGMGDDDEEEDEEDAEDCLVPCPDGSGSECSEHAAVYWDVQRRQLDAFLQQYKSSVARALDDLDVATQASTRESSQALLSRAMAAVMRDVYEGLMSSLANCQAISGDKDSPCYAGSAASKDAGADAGIEAVSALGSFF